jgi:hypothetical protein
LFTRLLTLAAACAAIASCGDDDGDRPDPVEVLEILTRELPAGRVGEPYAAVLTSRGGRSPYEYRGGSGELPPGVTLEVDGLVAGTPAREGSYSLEVVVADADGGRARRVIPMTVEPPAPVPLRFVTEVLPPADRGEPYEQALVAEGGTPPYAWSLLEGALPDGITLQGDTGTLTGVPGDVLGLHTFTIALTDAGGAEPIERELEIAVAPAPVLETDVFPIAVVGRPYRASLEVTGGAWPLAFEVWSGNLPDGLALDRSGILAGTPTEADSRPVRFRVTDAAGVVRERRIRVWAVEDEPWEEHADVEVPPNCGLVEPIVVRSTVEVDDPAMITRVQVAVDVEYDDMGMVDLDVVAPDATRVTMHVGGPRVGGGPSIHFMYERDRVSWGSFAPLIGRGPRGTWAFEVRVLPDPGFGCVGVPGVLQRFAVVLGQERSGDDYLRVSGFEPNNLIDGPFARITGGGLVQDRFDLVVELWSAGANGIAEGATGDDFLIEIADVDWSSDLPADVGVLDPGGRMSTGESTGAGTMTGVYGERTIELPVKVVAPDWVP